MRIAALAATIALLLAPAAAGATEVSRAELVALAVRAAAGDTSAAAELDAVTTVEGAAVDVQAALDGATGTDREARLRELSASAGAAPDPALPDALPEQADPIDESGEPAPAPDSSDGGGGFAVPLWLAVALAALAVVLGAVAARSAAARRVLEPGRERAGPAARRARPPSFEREADEAERRGDYAGAVRLRFRAGLERLADSGALRVHPALTAPGAARELRSSALVALASAYDEIVFGGRPALAADADAARSGWGEVLREAGR